jgi:benzoyl-CoA reductase/2-hydroxyglutaryl-CoA dehydratase subunit BcrC/BadD/HgdB
LLLRSIYRLRGSIKVNYKIIKKLWKDVFRIKAAMYDLAADDTPDEKKVGFLCPYTVEELIDAAGFVPYRIIPESPDMDLVDAYLPNNVCSYLRHLVDLAAKDGLRGYAGIVVNNSCDAARRTYDVLTSHMGGLKIFFQDIPKKCDAPAVHYFSHILGGFIDFLEGISGMPLQKTAVRQSIGRYNKNRALLSELFSLRAHYPLLLRSEPFLNLFDANVRRPKGEMNSVIVRFLGEVRKEIDENRRAEKKRVFVSGNLINPHTFFSIIEEAGGVIVGDDLCFGGRYFTHRTEENGDPVKNLAQSYLTRTPCGRMLNSSDRCDAIIDTVKRFRAHGVVYTSLKFCDNFLVDYPSLKKRLDTEGVPSLFLESEYYPMGKGQILTRIEGFLERIA